MKDFSIFTQLSINESDMKQYLWEIEWGLNYQTKHYMCTSPLKVEIWQNLTGERIYYGVGNSAASIFWGEVIYLSWKSAWRILIVILVRLQLVFVENTQLLWLSSQSVSLRTAEGVYDEQRGRKRKRKEKKVSKTMRKVCVYVCVCVREREGYVFWAYYGYVYNEEIPSLTW